MMKTSFFITVLIIICFVVGPIWNASSQVIERCGTVTKTNEWLAEHPEMVDQFNKTQLELDLKAQKDAMNPSKLDDTTIYVVPMVFHIIHQNGAENISDAAVFAAVRILNEDFRKWNWDTSLVDQSFKPIIGEAFIEFRLAQLDPNGNPTNGIDRIVSAETNVGDDGSKLNSWPRSKYLNIWVTKIVDGAAAYAYLPGMAWAPWVDGIIVRSVYVGEGERTLTHEVGHWINLSHPWGPSNTPGLSTNCQSDDGVSDTPNTIGVDDFSCDTTDNSCSSLDNVQNFMDYSACELMFTEGQVSRMRSSLDTSIAQRNNLWQANNLISTGVYGDSVNFEADVITVCTGSPIQFRDMSYNAMTGWAWSFPGATPDSAFGKYPTVNYNVPGNYDVTVTVSKVIPPNDDTISVTLTKTNYITVTSALSLPYVQSFATSGDWAVMGVGGAPWIYSSGISFSGSGGSMMIDNFNNGYNGDIDVGIGPVIDLNVMQSAQFQFEVAYARLTAATNELLMIYVSGDCGENWTLLQAASSTTLAGTNGIQSTSFAPADSNDWKTFSQTISGSALTENFRYKFEFTSDGGNNIYIDNINITGTFNSVPFLVFPANFSTNNMLGLTLDWDAIDNVSSYEYQIDTAEAFNSPFLITGSNSYLGTADNLSDTEYQLSGLDTGWTIYWKVRSVAPLDTSDWSATWRFTTVKSLSGVSEMISDKLEIQAYPNPTSDGITLALVLTHPAERLSIEVYDLLGRNSNNQTNRTYRSLGVGKHKFSIEKFDEPGIYTIRVNIDGSSYFIKIINLN